MKNLTRKAVIICLALLLFANIAVTVAKPLASVARAQFTTGIHGKEPTDQVVLLGNDITEIYYFTDLRHLSGQTITHRWEYDGETVSDVPIKVKGPRWRTDSRMILDPSLLGRWTVLVLDQSGWVLKATTFEYVPAGLAR